MRISHALCLVALSIVMFVVPNISAAVEGDIIIGKAKSSVPVHTAIQSRRSDAPAVSVQPVRYRGWVGFYGGPGFYRGPGFYGGYYGPPRYYAGYRPRYYAGYYGYGYGPAWGAYYPPVPAPAYYAPPPYYGSYGGCYYW